MEFFQRILGRVEHGVEGGVVEGGDLHGPDGVGEAELLLDVAGEDVARTADELAERLEAEVVAEDAVDVGAGEVGAGLEGVAELGVAGLVELALLVLEGAEGGDDLGDLVGRGDGEAELVSQGEAGDALQGVLLDLVALQGVVAGLEADAPGGVGEDAAGLLGVAQVVAEEGALEDLAAAVAVTRAARGAVDEDHGQGHGDQDGGENEAEVLLKVALDPGNHGGKGADAWKVAGRCQQAKRGGFAGWTVMFRRLPPGGGGTRRRKAGAAGALAAK
jgi:hypothetical protein